MLKAVNTLGRKQLSSFIFPDTSGWIIGNLKIDGEWLGMEDKARSAFVIADGKPQIMKDLAYNGSVMLPALGVNCMLKGSTGNVLRRMSSFIHIILARRHEQIVLAVRYVLKMVRSLKSVKQGTCA